MDYTCANINVVPSSRAGTGIRTGFGGSWKVQEAAGTR